MLSAIQSVVSGAIQRLNQDVNTPHLSASYHPIRFNVGGVRDVTGYRVKPSKSRNFGRGGVVCHLPVSRHLGGEPTAVALSRSRLQSPSSVTFLTTPRAAAASGEQLKMDFVTILVQ